MYYIISVSIICISLIVLAYNFYRMYVSNKRLDKNREWDFFIKNSYRFVKITDENDPDFTNKSYVYIDNFGNKRYIAFLFDDCTSVIYTPSTRFGRKQVLGLQNTEKSKELYSRIINRQKYIRS